MCQIDKPALWCREGRDAALMLNQKEQNFGGRHLHSLKSSYINLNLRDKQPSKALL